MILRASVILLALFSVSNAFASAGISPGDPAPEIAAKNQDGKMIRLSDFRGKPVILFFYPKDDTPGCTKEACSFRDEYSKFKSSGAAVLGISRQDEKSHQAFKSKHRLPFDLLVDENGSIAKAFDVGTMLVIGLHKRQSVLIGPDGKIVKFYRDVDPSTHVEQVLKDLEQLR